MGDYTKQTDWKRKNTSFFGFRLTNSIDGEMIAWIRSKPSMNDYIRQLIKADMEAHGVTTEKEAE